MKRKLPLLKLRKSCVLICSFFGMIFSLHAQDVKVISVDPTSNVLTINNPGSMLADLTNYQLCLGPGTYVRIGTLTPLSGNIMLEAGESVTLSYTMDAMADGLSLFSNSNFGSSNSTDLIDYVQWGAANQPRVSQAVTAGRWDDANNFVSGSAPYTTTSGGSAAAWSACDVEGGAIQIAGTTDTTATICVGEGTDDLIPVEFVDMGVLNGDSSTWVITDQATGDILGVPATQPAGGFNLEGAPTGICDIWYLRYTGDIGLGSATNVSDLSGCFDLSNPISISRNAVNGGAIQITGTTDTTATICVGEGTDDLIPVEFVDMSVLSGDSSTWVITDQATGDILGAPATQPAGGFNLEGAPTGICDIWYLRYTGDIGLATAANVSDLSGCFDLSNPISVSRNAVNGGAIQIAGTTHTTATICVGEGTDDLIPVEFVDMSVLSGDSSTWVITDQATGDILGAPVTQPAGGFNLEGAPTGICDIWYLRYTGDIGLGSATNVSDLSGCFDLSNPISVSRNAVNGGAIQIAGTTDTTATVCVGEGMDDLIDVEFTAISTTSGDSGTWVITDQATGNILGTPSSVPAGGFNLESAPEGICDIWYLRYTGDIGLASATNVSDLSGCFDLSNPISVTRFTGMDCDNICDTQGGQIQIAGTTDTTAMVCVGEGTDDLIPVEFVDMSVLSGDSSTWVITDQATGDILGAPATQPAGGFNLEVAPTGICDIWYLRYTGDIGLATATNVSDLSGCFDLSNPISVSRNAVNGGAIQIVGTTDTTATICVGEGTDDLIPVEFVDMSVLSGDSSTWVITDQATGDILGAPATQPAGGFNLEGAPTGICDIWYLRYTGDIGLATATNVSDLSGCFDLSNPISVSRNAVNGGEIQIAGTTDSAISICVGEGTDDLIDVEFTASSVASGDNATWVITDQATGNILGTPASVPAGGFNLESAPAGICDIWYLRYTGDIGLASATNVSDLSGCFDLSNPISVTRLTGMDCDTLSASDFESEFSFAVYPNPAQNEITISYRGNQNLELDVQVLDMLGKQAVNTNFSTSRDIKLDISLLNSGTYFINITDRSSGSSTVKRIIKN